MPSLHLPSCIVLAAAWGKVTNAFLIPNPHPSGAIPGFALLIFLACFCKPNRGCGLSPCCHLWATLSHTSSLASRYFNESPHGSHLWLFITPPVFPEDQHRNGKIWFSARACDHLSLCSPHRLVLWLVALRLARCPQECCLLQKVFDYRFLTLFKKSMTFLFLLVLPQTQFFLLFLVLWLLLHSLTLSGFLLKKQRLLC